MAVASCTTLIGLRDDYHVEDAGSDATTPPEGGGGDGHTEAAADGASDAGIDATRDASADVAIGADGALDAGDSGDAGNAGDALAEAMPDGPLSCVGLEAGCGPSGALESCCASTYVEGGTFLHQTVGEPADANVVEQPDASSSVSGFRLDKYLVTVARFRNFVAAMNAGWYPQNGQGKHGYLPEGGLWSTMDQATEMGWREEYNAIEYPPGYDGGSLSLPTSAAGWNNYLTNAECTPNAAMWTPDAGPYDDHPINCVSWEGAYAFCIWDGGFLPTDAEYNYAQSGGSEQRLYPWSVPPGDAAIDPSYASYGTANGSCYGAGGATASAHSCSSFDHTVPGSKPAGNGKWGQSDLVGNIPEYTLDCFTPIPSGCTDCGPVGVCPTDHVYRTVLANAVAADVISAVAGEEKWYSLPLIGFRCARAP